MLSSCFKGQSAQVRLPAGLVPPGAAPAENLRPLPASGGGSSPERAVPPPSPEPKAQHLAIKRSSASYGNLCDDAGPPGKSRPSPQPRSFMWPQLPSPLCCGRHRVARSGGQGVDVLGDRALSPTQGSGCGRLWGRGSVPPHTHTLSSFTSNAVLLYL